MSTIIQALLENVKRAQDVIREAVPHFALPRKCGCPTALDTALITDRQAIAPADLEFRIGDIALVADPGGSPDRTVCEQVAQAIEPPGR